MPTILRAHFSPEDELSKHVSQIQRISDRYKLFFVNGRNRVNLRAASEKSGDKYWFDVSGTLLEKNRVHYFVYFCGSPTSAYVFPASFIISQAARCSLGGSRQNPNFTIFMNRHLFEPAGKANSRTSISSYFNAFSQL